MGNGGEVGWERMCRRRGDTDCPTITLRLVEKHSLL